MGNKIVYADWTFTDTEILSGSCFIGESMTGDALAVDTLEATVWSDCLQGEEIIPSDSDGFQLSDTHSLFVSAGGADLSAYTYGAPVYFYHEDALAGQFYLQSITRKGSTSFALACTSAVGILDRLTHYGGMYSGATVAEVAAEIIGTAVPYSIDTEIGSLPVYGWLPVASCRENLHQLLFAVGASLKKDTAGGLVISFLRDETCLEIPDGRLYLGGTAEYPTPATEAQVTEHGYAALAADKTVTLFDNTDGWGAVTDRLVTFSNPCHDLAASGLTITQSGVNFAVVSGTGTLTGKEYTHTTRIIAAAGGDAAGDTSTVSVTDATLVSVANSQNVADRLLAYHSAARTVSCGLIVGAERPGDAVRFLSPFGEGMRGIVKEMEIALSGLLRADAVFVTDYTPTGLGNYYTASIAVAASGTYSLSQLGIPLDKTHLRIVCIGGGAGGTSGADGQAGTQDEAKAESGVLYATGGDGGDGGAAGTAGSGGNIFVTTVSISSASTILVSAGAAGASDTAGGNTVCTVDGTTYTSAAGATNTLGYTDTLTGLTYAYAGADGTAGAAGGAGGGSYSGQDLAQDGTAGTAVGTASGGTGGTAAGENNAEGWGGADGASGGGGGGAAYCTNGASGGNASVTWNSTYPTHAEAIANGAGGAGASPANGAAGRAYGCGGSGGHGGGGGGGAGGFLEKEAVLTYHGGGTGGKGSQGGTGGAGCVIIYY